MKRKKLLMSWVSYVVVCGALALLNWYKTPDYYWVLWVVGGWGLAQLLSTAEYFIIGDEGNSKEETSK